ncbi:cysteine rich repeat-containing protein [Bradyrhizobium sp. Ai1a-2]|uniref:cysteine rich repeat-containing protein n=1 Tax=Bradyrhizobium sp. Ai1a-2 TaxID=196490 RepID=UPI00042949AD|nr:cysteine rich repeat-containing protein [Bradyrhizobium sp. Ai1a-2]
MIETLKRACGRALPFSVVLFATAALAQAPSEAQREAIKSQCRSDYMAHCSSIPPGGEASLQCLQKNMSSLSAGCASAVRAAEAPAAPKAETAPKPDAAPAKTETPAAATAAKPKAAGTQAKPSEVQVTAMRSACRSDYQKFCPGVPTGGAPALQCLVKNKARLSPPCGEAVAAASGGAAPAAGGGSTAAAAAPAAAPAAGIVLRPLRPREELLVVRSACGADVRSLCGGVAPGGGRIAQCLATNAASLSPACKEVLGQFAAR